MSGAPASVVPLLTRRNHARCLKQTSALLWEETDCECRWGCSAKQNTALEFQQDKKCLSPWWRAFFIFSWWTSKWHFPCSWGLYLIRKSNIVPSSSVLTGFCWCRADVTGWIATTLCVFINMDWRVRVHDRLPMFSVPPAEMFLCCALWFPTNMIKIAARCLCLVVVLMADFFFPRQSNYFDYVHLFKPK